MTVRYNKVLVEVAKMHTSFLDIKKSTDREQLAFIILN